MARTGDTMDLVKKAAGAGANVAPFLDMVIPHVELYYLVTRTASGKSNGRGIAVVNGKLPWLEGSKAMTAVVAAGVHEAPALARTAAFLLLDRGKLLERAGDLAAPLPPAQAAAITPPVKQGNTLEFWYFAGRPGVLRVKLDLSTWTWTTTDLDTIVQSGQDPVNLALTWIADPGEARNKMGIDRLVAACANPRAPEAILQTLKTHANGGTRALAAAALATCRPPAAISALTDALAKDGDVRVRKAAIESLGSIGDPAARTALEIAARSDADTDARAYAEWALGKLPPR